jgi:hypothetical protein
MFCPQCGSRIPEDGLFCGECGAKLKDSTGYGGYTGTPARQRPIGLTVIVIFLAFGALVAIPSCVFFFSQSQFLLPTSAKTLMVVSTLFSLLEGPAAYGLWTWQKWGLTLVKVIYGINIPLSIIQSFLVGLPTGDWADSFIAVASMIVGIAIAILILWYVSKPEIKRLFQ